jgi:hypothetical protein
MVQQCVDPLLRAVQGGTSMRAPLGGVGGLCAILAGAAGFLYAVSFLIVSRAAPDAGRLLSAIFLLLGGLLSTAALTAVYERLRSVNEPAALWALLLGIVAVMGAAIHGGYDLATAAHPVAGASTEAPSQVDPRGLLTFGVTGLALIMFGRLITTSAALPHGLGSLAYVQGALLVLLYLGRLIILTPANPLIVIPAVLSGFVAGPAWYIWLGLVLRGSGT